MVEAHNRRIAAGRGRPPSYQAPDPKIAPSTSQTPRKGVLKRLRQSSRPLMNRLELEYLRRLQGLFPNQTFRCQAVKFRLANGVWLTPDIVNIELKDIYEVKGQWFVDDAKVKIKVAAAMYPEFVWHLVWKDKETNHWCDQTIIP